MVGCFFDVVGELDDFVVVVGYPGLLECPFEVGLVECDGGGYFVEGWFEVGWWCELAFFSDEFFPFPEDVEDWFAGGPVECVDVDADGGFVCVCAFACFCWL